MAAAASSSAVQDSHHFLSFALQNVYTILNETIDTNGTVPKNQTLPSQSTFVDHLPTWVYLFLSITCIISLIISCIQNPRSVCSPQKQFLGFSFFVCAVSFVHFLCLQYAFDYTYKYTCYYYTQTKRYCYGVTFVDSFLTVFVRFVFIRLVIFWVELLNSINVVHEEETMPAPTPASPQGEDLQKTFAPKKKFVRGVLSNKKLIMALYIVAFIVCMCIAGGFILTRLLLLLNPETRTSDFLNVMSVTYPFIFVVIDGLVMSCFLVFGFFLIRKQLKNIRMKVVMVNSLKSHLNKIGYLSLFVGVYYIFAMLARIASATYNYILDVSSANAVSGILKVVRLILFEAVLLIVMQAFVIAPSLTYKIKGFSLFKKKKDGDSTVDARRSTNYYEAYNNGVTSSWNSDGMLLGEALLDDSSELDEDEQASTSVTATSAISAPKSVYDPSNDDDHDSYSSLPKLSFTQKE